MAKYKYYFKKPKIEIVKDILTWLAIGGAIAVAATSPYFAANLFRSLQKTQKYGKKKVYDTFYRLRKEGCIDVKEQNHQLYISLTEKGRRKAGMYQINDLKIQVPRKWDGKWRIVMFDIAELARIKREALRGMFRNLHLYPLQKSVWIHPYDCKDEIGLLRDFFGLSQKEVQYIVAEYVEDEQRLRKIFDL